MTALWLSDIKTQQALKVFKNKKDLICNTLISQSTFKHLPSSSVTWISVSSNPEFLNPTSVFRIQILNILTNIPEYEVLC